MEQTLIQLITDAGTTFLHSVNWLFVAVFTLLTWLLNEGADHPTSFKWLNWLQNISKPVRALIFGLLLAIPFAWLYDCKTKEDISGLIYAIFIGMAVWKMGIDKVVNWVKEYILKLKKPTP